MKAVLFHPDAEEEMIASAVFYETRSNGLGHKLMKKSNLKLLFKKLFDTAIADIYEMTLIFTKKLKEIPA